MTDLDEEIKRALSAEERDLALQFEELGLIGQFKSVFRGKTAWVSIASLIVGTILQILFFYVPGSFLSSPARMKNYCGAGRPGSWP